MTKPLPSAFFTRRFIFAIKFYKNYLLFKFFEEAHRTMYS